MFRKNKKNMSSRGQELARKFISWAWKISLVISVFFVMVAIIVGVTTQNSSKDGNPSKATGAIWIVSVVFFFIFLILVVVWLVVRGNELSEQLKRLNSVHTKIK